jgi:hypothetical protein
VRTVVGLLVVVGHAAFRHGCVTFELVGLGIGVVWIPEAEDVLEATHQSAIASRRAVSTGRDRVSGGTSKKEVV